MATGPVQAGAPRVLAGALLVSLSRVYLGHHFPTDVVGGAALGAGVGAAAHGLALAPGLAWPRRLGWLVWPQVALALLITLLAYLGLIPWRPGFAHGDKLMHFLLFGAVVLWLNLWLRDRRLALPGLRLALPGLRLALPGLRPPLALVLAFGGALAEELCQRWSANRTFEVADLAADLAGMTACYLLSRLLLRRAPEAPQGKPLSI